MKVKVQIDGKDVIIDSFEQPVMIILSPEEKQLIHEMKKGNSKFCSFPEKSERADIEAFMKGDVINEK